MSKKEKCCLNCKIHWDRENCCEVCRWEDQDNPSLFYQITRSPEVLAEKFVYEKSVSLICAGYGCDRYEYKWYWFSTIIPYAKFDTKPDAVAATLIVLNRRGVNDEEQY